MEYLLRLHGKNGYANACECYVYMYIACIFVSLLTVFWSDEQFLSKCRMFLVFPVRSHISVRIFSDRCHSSADCVRTSTERTPAFAISARDRPPRTAAVIRSSLSWKWPLQTNLKKSELQCHCLSTLRVIQPTATLAACCCSLQSIIKPYFTYGYYPAFTIQGGRTQRFNAVVGHDHQTIFYLRLLSCIYYTGWQNPKIQRRSRARSPPSISITYPV
jgi:hypothetical protein